MGRRRRRRRPDGVEFGLRVISREHALLQPAERPAVDRQGLEHPPRPVVVSAARRLRRPVGVRGRRAVQEAERLAKLRGEAVVGDLHLVPLAEAGM